MEDNQMLYDEILKDKTNDIKDGLSIEDMFKYIQQQELEIRKRNIILDLIRHNLIVIDNNYTLEEEIKLLIEELIENINAIL